MTVERLEHESVEGLRVGRFRLGINTTCIVYRVGSTLVDAGPPNQWTEVRRFARERDVRQVALTHHHEDHSGNAARMQADFGARVFCPERGLAAMRRGFPLRPYQRVVWGTPGRLEPEASPEELILEGGLLLRAVPAPGHSPDMTCYLEPERGWLFSGDLYIASRPRFLRADEDVGEQVETLERFLTLDFETMFCAHRGVVADGRRALGAKRDYLVSLRDEVRHLAAGGRSVPEITRQLLGRETVLSRLTFYHFSKRNLVRACLAGTPRPAASPGPGPAHRT